ncbi:MAG TPA: type II toxin-antitoxin system HicB family antitoxin [Solirubrobacter sp.]|nr:type II toxin-antitoxin system HicB family antitoxin [Solirubrobacter sp.]
MTERQYLIVIEGNQEAGFSAYVPDLPGCVAAGKTGRPSSARCTT